MTTRYVSRQKAVTMLQGHRVCGAWIEGFILSAEVAILALQVVCLYRLDNLVAGIILGGALDLLILSPLKVGRARYYQQLVRDPTTAKFTDCLYFFRYRYERTVWWRIRLWMVRCFWSTIFSLPSAGIFTVCLMAEERGASMVAVIAFILAIVLFIFSLILTEIMMFRYIPVAYCLAEHTVRQSFERGLKCDRKFYGQWTLFHVEYAGFVLVFWLLLPYFLITPVFYAAQAATVHQLFCKNSERNTEQHLKHHGNHGKIVGEF